MLRLWQLLGGPSRSWQGCPDSDSVRECSHRGRFTGSYKKVRTVCFPIAKEPDGIYAHIRLKIAQIPMLSCPPALSPPRLSSPFHLPFPILASYNLPSLTLVPFPPPTIRVLSYRKWTHQKGKSVWQINQAASYWNSSDCGTETAPPHLLLFKKYFPYFCTGQQLHLGKLRSSLYASMDHTCFVFLKGKGTIEGQKKGGSANGAEVAHPHHHPNVRPWNYRNSHLGTAH